MILNQIRRIFHLLVVLFLGLTLSFSSYAQMNGNNRKALMDFAKSMKLDKGQMEKSIDMLQQSGRISKEEAEKAKRQLEHYSEDDVKALQEQAVQRIKSGETPESMMKELEDDSNSQKSKSNFGSSSKKDKKKSGSSPKAADVDKEKVREAVKESEGYKEALEYLNN